MALNLIAGFVFMCMQKGQVYCSVFWMYAQLSD